MAIHGKFIASSKKLQKMQKMQKQDTLYGTTTMGARGQVVIPANARRDLRLKPGDQLVVMGKFGKALGLMKTSELDDFIHTIMSHVAGSPIESKVKDHLDTLFGKLQKSKK